MPPTLTQEDLARFDAASPEDVLRWGVDEFHPRLAIVTGFQAEGMVVIDLAARVARDIRVFTIDSGRLPDETYELIDQVRGRYGIVVEVLFPDPKHVESMVERHGLNLFRHDVALRMLCCYARKVAPLERALERVDAWITGLRRTQSEERARTPKVQIDTAHGGIVKLNPIADWTQDRVWEYVRANKVPYNALYDRGYRSIGCAPCTRSIGPGEPERAGRWWWEGDQTKECGIHGESQDERFREELRWLLNGSGTAPPALEKEDVETVEGSEQ